MFTCCAHGTFRCFELCSVCLKVPKCEILMSRIVMFFFIMKSIQVGDLRAEIKFLHFLQMGEILAILFSHRMRRLRQQIATVCAVYASKVLPHAPHTLGICYRMLRLRQQNTQFYTVLLPHAPCTLANCYRMRRLCQQFATAYASNLLPYAPSMLAICYRMRRIRQQSATACAVYANTRSPSILFCSSYRICRLCQQSATVCGAYASNLLAYAPSTLASRYRMRRICQNLLPHTLAICNRMRSIRLQKLIFT